MGQDLHKLSAEAGIAFLTCPLPLDPGHRTVAVDVAVVIYATGLSQWNNVEVCPTTPVAAMMANLDAFPIVFE